MHGNGVKPMEPLIDPDHWICECDGDNVTPVEQAECRICGARRSERPLATVAEVEAAKARVAALTGSRERSDEE